jgi:hypothetical protein
MILFLLLLLRICTKAEEKAPRECAAAAVVGFGGK